MVGSVVSHEDKEEIVAIRRLESATHNQIICQPARATSRVLGLSALATRDIIDSLCHVDEGGGGSTSRIASGVRGGGGEEGIAVDRLDRF